MLRRGRYCLYRYADCIEVCNFASWIKSEEDPYSSRVHEACADRDQGDRRIPAGCEGDDLRRDDDASDTAHDAHEHRLGEKLPPQMKTSRAHRHAQKDFAGAFGDRHQDNIHDADAADEERNRCDRSEQKHEDFVASLGGFGNLIDVTNVEILRRSSLGPMASRQSGGDLRDGDRRLRALALNRLRIHRGQR